MMPITGEVIMGRTTLGQRPPCLPAASTVCQWRTDQWPPLVAMAAPHSPPMSAWLELEGRPSHQVKMFQMMALIRAASTVVMLIAEASTRPLPIVLATAVPASAPTRFQKAAQTMAWRGVRTLVETTVAIAFAVS